MFYFLEGAEARPICRACLSRQEPAGRGAVDDWSGVEPLHLGVPTDEGLAGETAREPRRLTDAVRSLLIEEVDRVDLAIERLPEQDPDLPLVRSIGEELRHALSASHLAEALVSLRDLRRILAAKNVGRSPGSLSAPWDESVEELFDRVMARALAMSRKASLSTDQVENLDSLAIPSRVRPSGAPS